MPIVIDRKTGEVLSASKYTEEEKEEAWKAIVLSAAKAHPELFLNFVEEEKDKGPE